MEPSPEPFPWNHCPICGTAMKPEFDNERDRPFCAPCGRFYYHNPIPVVLCFVPRNNDELLFARRGVEPCIGQWCLPGGFMEPGESPEESALRELEEETGLIAGKATLIGTSATVSRSHGALIALGYLMENCSGKPCAGSDVREVAYYPQTDRPPIPFHVHRDLLRQYDVITEAVS